MSKKEIYTQFPFSKKQAISSSFGLSIVINIILIVSFLFLSLRINPATPIRWSHIFIYFILHFICNMMLLYVLYRFSNWLIIRKGAHRRSTTLKVLFGTLLICGFMSPILSQIQWSFYSVSEQVGGFNLFMAFNLVKDIVLGVLALFETGIRYSTYKRNQTIIVNQNLMKENIKTRYQALKSQLDPHFLFNSLNTLNGLIGIDDDKAREYVDNLSSVFRYTLRSKNICSLNQEIEFVNSYIALLKIRFGDNLVVRYDIEEKYQNYYIIPISLQLLVENAIKHNIISNKKPLFILIETTDRDSIIVQNLINPKLKESEGSGVGLANLVNRYSILFNKSINITNADGMFTVEIPLINKIREKEKLILNYEL